jgi:hypothetical protein
MTGVDAEHELVETLEAMVDRGRPPFADVSNAAVASLFAQLRRDAILALYLIGDLPVDSPVRAAMDDSDLRIQAHLRAIVPLLDRALEQRDVDERAIQAAGEHMAPIVVFVEALRRSPAP